MSPEDLERAINFLVEHVVAMESTIAQIRTELRRMRTDLEGGMVTKQEVAELRQAVLNYDAHVENLISMITRGRPMAA